MAEERKTNWVTTQLNSHMKWPQDSSQLEKRCRFSYSLINDFYTFEIANADKEGKFGRDAKRIQTFVNQDKIAEVMYMAKEMCNRISAIIDNKKELSKEALISHNSRGKIQDATMALEFNVYSGEQEGSISGYIKVTRKDKDSDKSDSNIFWLGNAKTYYRGSQTKHASDFEAYQIFMSMYLALEACIARTSLTRDRHLKKWLDAEKGDSSDNNSNGGRDNRKESEDTNSDFPF